MKRNVLLFFVLAFSIFFLVGCNGLTSPTTGDEKAVPVYQGMVVSESLTALSSNDGPDDNLIQFGYSANDSKLLSADPINQDDPFGDTDTDTIDDVISTEYIVTPSDEADYYSEINTDIYITVKLSNPDNYVILSFILNSVFYQSFQFQEGSDSENLILKVNTGDTRGIKEYTIDAIKYVDGTEIKDVIFEGERTITVGLAYYATPSISVSNEVINATSMTIDINFSDASSASTLNKVVLYDGSELVQTYDLIAGNNSITFDKLNINTLYQCAIVSIYDLIDGQNSRLEILSKQAFYTDDIVAINDVVPTQESIGFGITVTDVDQVGAVSAIDLYKGEILVEAFADLNTREFAGLLSNNEYTIKVTYTYDLNDGVGEQTLVIQQATTTIAKATPTVVFDNVVPTQESIGFGITVTDVDQVGAVSAIELYKGEILVETLSNLSQRIFFIEFDPSEYTIKVTYTYNLNDGTEIHVLASICNLSSYEYSIAYFLDGGTNSVENPYTYTLLTSTFVFKAPIQDGYTFLGWYDNPEFSGGQITFHLQGLAGNISLYAKWQVNQYALNYYIYIDFDPTLNYDFNEFWVNHTESFYSITIIDGITFVDYNKPLGYEWTCIESVFDPEEVEGLNTMTLVLQGTNGLQVLLQPNNNIALEQWVTFDGSEQTIVITFDAFDSLKMFAEPFTYNATGSFKIINATVGMPFVEPTLSQTDVYDFASETPEYTPTLVGYTFGGWYLDADLIIPYAFPTMPASDITLFGRWIPIG